MTVGFSQKGEQVMPQDEGPDLGLRVLQPAPRQATEAPLLFPLGKC
jgi:hypothetical protein